MALPLILLGAGTVLSAWGSIQSGQAQANAANDAARMRDLEAAEVLERLKINRRSIFDQGEKFKVRQRQSIAKQGRLSDDSTLSMLEDTNAQVVREIYNLDREANFRAQGLRIEGDFARQRGSELERAGYVNAFSTLLTSGFHASKYLSSGGKKPQSESLFTGQTYRSDFNTRDIGKFGMYA